ncbi:Spy/CpxP family protein refolding chaperone [Acidicapsa acidisoli]|uniref:Spy/CpxP family protein refolding chaperone n=1 Tax=Acidicapsa acidisoli TaxID=1615681 RepID=UPI0021E0149B|nr:Spy/CpxP family protein refolding chaperone [Acidicapsa acidisoli]
MATGTGASGMRKIGAGLAVAVLAVVGAATVWAQGPEGGLGMGPHRPPMEREMGPQGDHPRWWNGQHAIEKLKLTDAQRKAMDDIYMQHRLTLVDLHATLEKAELAMEPLMSADQPDEGRILAQIDQVAQARAELEKANARMLLGLRRQLTPEQWKIMQADRAARRESMHHGGSGQGDGPRWHRDGQGSGASGGGTPPPSPGSGENE